VELVRFARASRARYVVVAPRDLRVVDALERLARETLDGTRAISAVDPSSAMLARLALAPEVANSAVSAGAEPVPGFVRVYASVRRVGVSGHAPEPGESAGPAISIYRVTDPAALAPAPEIRPR